MSYFLQFSAIIFSISMFIFLFNNTQAAINTQNPLNILNDLFNKSSVKNEPTTLSSPFPSIDKILRNSFPSSESSQKINEKLGVPQENSEKKTNTPKEDNIDEALGLNDEILEEKKNCQTKPDGTCMTENEIREQKIAEQNQQFTKDFMEKMQQGQSPQSGGGGGGQPPSGGGGGGEQGGGKGGGGQAQPEEGGSVAKNDENLDEECKHKGINKPTECRKIKPTKVSEIKPLQSRQMIQLVHSSNLESASEGKFYTEDDKFFTTSPHSSKYLAERVKYVVCPDTQKPGCKIPIKPVYVRMDAKAPTRPINFVPGMSI